jgi:O-acetyl-ADP-ribose deacetylase (regulator of RNase III)
VGFCPYKSSLDHEFIQRGYAASERRTVGIQCVDCVREGQKSMRMPRTQFGAKVTLADQDTDAVVTAAHWRLNKGTGTDGTIHTKGGPRIYEECRRIGGCPIGDAVITTGGDLRARHVIHAVGPVWRGGDEHEPELLASAYRRSLEVAVQQGLRSISFPSISTGAFVYPLRLAAPVALKTIIEFLEREQHSLGEVRMVLYSREDDRAYPIFADALQRFVRGRAEPDAAADGPSTSL